VQTASRTGEGLRSRHRKYLIAHVNSGPGCRFLRPGSSCPLPPEIVRTRSTDGGTSLCASRRCPQRVSGNDGYCWCYGAKDFDSALLVYCLELPRTIEDALLQFLVAVEAMQSEAGYDDRNQVRSRFPDPNTACAEVSVTGDGMDTGPRSLGTYLLADDIVSSGGDCMKGDNEISTDALVQRVAGDSRLRCTIRNHREATNVDIRRTERRR
jgi:hypothetical protein